MCPNCLQVGGGHFSNFSGKRKLQQGCSHKQRSDGRRAFDHDLERALDRARIASPNGSGEGLGKAEALDVVGHAAQKRRQHERSRFAIDPRRLEQLDPAGGKGNSPIGGERGRRVVADRIEVRNRARRHSDELRERAGTTNRHGIALDVDVAVRERGVNAGRSKRNHRMHLSHAAANRAQRCERLGVDSPCNMHTNSCGMHVLTGGQFFGHRLEIAVTDGEHDHVGLDFSRQRLTSGPQRDLRAGPFQSNGERASNFASSQNEHGGCSFSTHAEARYSRRSPSWDIRTRRLTRRGKQRVKCVQQAHVAIAQTARVRDKACAMRRCISGAILGILFGTTLAFSVVACAVGDGGDESTDIATSDPLDASAGSSNSSGGGYRNPSSTSSSSSSSSSSSASSSSGGGFRDAATPVDSGASKADAGTVKDSGSPGRDASVPPVDAGPAGAKPAAGEVLITEVMYNPSGPEPDEEWIEITNVASASRDLRGLTIKDGSGRTHSISASVHVASGAYVVLARDRAGATAAKLPVSSIVYEYGAGATASGGVLLGNSGSGGVSIYDGSTLVAGSNYGGWYTTDGQSLQLKTPTAAASTAKASWCVSSTAWAAGADKGTPGAASDCP